MADSSGSGSESYVGRLAVERKLLTPEELQVCYQEQRSLAQTGKRISLTEVMLKCGYVTRSQLQRLGGDMEDSIARKAQQIPGYQILGKLGAGAMATVFKARQLSLDRFVAIKLISQKHCQDELNRKRFLREIRSSSALQHP
ncbi:MAG: hypothetical protein HY718_15585, partial [Planctomycetes bacterium]|nr:hypothetical protein [Planctomycetota bacterium]